MLSLAEDAASLWARFAHMSDRFPAKGSARSFPADHSVVITLLVAQPRAMLVGSLPIILL
jgi:hypothetical protein